MTLWGNIVSKLRELIKSMIGSRTVQRELNVSYAISPKMETAIQLWTNLYMDKAPWLHEPDDFDSTRIVSLGLPAMIASEKARTALLEFESEITAPTEEVEVPNPDYPGEQQFTTGLDGEQIPIPTLPVSETIVEEHTVGDSSRAEYLESQYKKLKKQLRKQVEYGIAKGGLVIKPYIVMSKEQNSEGIDTDLAPTIDIEFDFVQADSFYPLAFDNAGRIRKRHLSNLKLNKIKFSVNLNIISGKIILLQ